MLKDSQLLRTEQLIRVDSAVSPEGKFENISKKLLPGGIASLLTQPFEVMKTNMINKPYNTLFQTNQIILQRGYIQYFRGSHLAVFRQAFGFAIYTGLIQFFNKKIEYSFQGVNKFYKYSFSALFANLITYSLAAPISLLKTRLQVLSSKSIKYQLLALCKNPIDLMTRGLGITLLSRTIYSVLHYNTYRYFKDDIFDASLLPYGAFAAGLLAGSIAIIVSQPFQVARSIISLKKSPEQSNNSIIKAYFGQFGAKGCFTGIVPRMMRKPINSAISWGIYQGFNMKNKYQ